MEYDQLSSQRSNYQYGRKRGTSDIFSNKFVKTDVHEYLEQDAHVTCISCVDCIKDKHKMVQYRYNPALKSSYADTY